jgi:predicted Zn-dependent protease
MRSIGLPEVLIILGLLVLLFGGARLPGLMGRLGHKVRSTINQLRWIWQSLAGSEDEEIRAEETVGREEAARFLEHMPPVADENLQGRVAAVGDRLARTNHAATRHFSFHVVEGPVANAYAFPGGYVFVTRRLAELCGDDEETAFLLGHEMGHILCRHFAENKVMTTLLGALRAGRLATELLGKGYSQQQEHEADLKGLELIRQADFPGAGALRLLRKFHQLAPGPPEFAQYFSTHPTAAERIESVSGALAASVRQRA